MSALLAVNWEWELRGSLIVIIAVGVLVGSIYLILGTNMGARLGFLVTFAALAGWMFILGGVWWMYGKGLLGDDTTWRPVDNTTIIRDSAQLSGLGILPSDDPYAPTGDHVADAASVQSSLQASGWKKLDAALPGFQQAGSAGSAMVESSEVFAAGEFTVVGVFDKGGERYPQFWDSKIDFLAFFHKPHYAVVEIAPLVPQQTEPGRAPARAVIDTSRPHEYVYMIRDLGQKRVPAAIICIGSLVIFIVLCWLLHTRDRRVLANRSAKALPAKA